LFVDDDEADFLNSNGTTNSTVSTEYANFLYLGICVMGETLYSDIIPSGIIQKLVSFFIFIFSKIFLSYFFAMSQNYNARNNSGYFQYFNKISNIKGWIRHHKIPLELSNRVTRHSETIWKKFKGSNYKDILDDLPFTLRREIQTHIFKDLVDKVEIFPKNDTGAIQTLITRLQMAIYTPGEYIIRYGEIANDMFFIVNGVVNILNKNEQILAELKSGQYFGEIALVQETTSVRNASVQAFTVSQIGILS